MDLGLDGRRALVLAATRGLGRGIAEALSREGAELAVVGRSGAAEAAEQIAGQGHAAAFGVDCDLHDRMAVDAMLDRVLDRFGGLDVLVLNGGGPPPGPALKVDAESWELWFHRMTATLIHVANRCVPGMVEQGWGRLLTVASSAAVQPIENMALSNSLRASLLAWNKTLAAEVGRNGVTCNVILPGRIHTERVDRLDAAKAERDGSDAASVRAQSQANIPLGRYGQVEEFGNVAAFVCSAPASYLTGDLIRVDGGLIRSIS